MRAVRPIRVTARRLRVPGRGVAAPRSYDAATLGRAHRRLREALNADAAHARCRRLDRRAVLARRRPLGGAGPLQLAPDAAAKRRAERDAVGRRPRAGRERLRVAAARRRRRRRKRSSVRLGGRERLGAVAGLAEHVLDADERQHAVALVLGAQAACGGEDKAAHPARVAVGALAAEDRHTPGRVGRPMRRGLARRGRGRLERSAVVGRGRPAVGVLVLLVVLGVLARRRRLGFVLRALDMTR